MTEAPIREPPPPKHSAKAPGEHRQRYCQLPPFPQPSSGRHAVLQGELWVRRAAIEVLQDDIYRMEQELLTLLPPPTEPEAPLLALEDQRSYSSAQSPPPMEAPPPAPEDHRICSDSSASVESLASNESGTPSVMPPVSASVESLPMASNESGTPSVTMPPVASPTSPLQWLQTKAPPPPPPRVFFQRMAREAIARQQASSSQASVFGTPLPGGIFAASSAPAPSVSIFSSETVGNEEVRRRRWCPARFQ